MQGLLGRVNTYHDCTGTTLGPPRRPAADRLSSLPFIGKVLRTVQSPGWRPWTLPEISTCEPAHERPHCFPRPKARSAVQAYAAVSARCGYDAVQEDHGRGRPRREGAGQGHA